MKNPMPDNDRSRKTQLFLLFLLTGIFLLNMLSRLAMAPLLPVLEEELGISHAVSGSFFLFIAMGYSIGLLASGFVAGKITVHRTIVCSALSSGLAFYLVALSDSVWAIRGGLLLLGIATGLYLPAGMIALTTAIGPANWGKAIAVHEFAPTLAFITAPLLTEGLIGFGGWKGIIVFIGTLSLILGLFFRRYAPLVDVPMEAPKLTSINNLVRVETFWIMVVFFALAVGATVGMYSMIPLFLVEERGIDRTTANSLLGLSRVPLLAVVLFAGWLSDRLGPKPVITAVMLFNGATITLLALSPGQWVIPMLFLQPLLSACFFPAGFTILSRIALTSSRSLYVSLTMFMANLVGGGVVPLVLGVFGDAKAFAVGFSLLGIIMMLSAFLMLRLDGQEPPVPSGSRRN